MKRSHISVVVWREKLRSSQVGALCFQNIANLFRHRNEVSLCVRSSGLWATVIGSIKNLSWLQIGSIFITILTDSSLVRLEQMLMLVVEGPVDSPADERNEYQTESVQTSLENVKKAMAFTAGYYGVDEVF